MSIRIRDGCGRRMRAAATMAAMAAVCVLPGITTNAAAQSGPTLHTAGSAGPAAVPGEIVVGFRSGVDGPERAAARSAADVRATRNLLMPGVQMAKVERGQTVKDAITALEQRARTFASPSPTGSTRPAPRLPMTRGSAVCGA